MKTVSIEQWIAHHNQMGWAYWIASAAFAGIAWALSLYIVFLVVIGEMIIACSFWKKYTAMRAHYVKERNHAPPD